MKLKKHVALAIATAFIAGASSLAHSGPGHAEKKTAIKMEQQDWGIAGDPKKVTMTITEDMLDTMRFSKDNLQVKQGDTVKFVLKNGGKIMHEFVIGTKKTLDEHAALMVKFPGMQHDQPYMAHVPPGKTGELVWTFNKPGNFDFACLIAGHYQAGMIGKITVAAK
jgi:uncharacterized cupredoxin-like copper-binding protein